MKTKRVATPHAGKFKAVFNSKIIEVRFLIILLLVISCSKSDDFVEPRNETPVDNESPIDDDSSNGDNPSNDDDSSDDDSSTDDKSEIIYTDIEPDFTSGMGADQYNLDIDNDGNVDFILTSNLGDEWFGSGIYTNSKNTNGILSLHPWYSHPAALDMGQKIFHLSIYRDGESYESGVLFAYGYCFGGGEECRYNWKGKGDRYVGLKFLKDEKIHFGWARLEFLNASEWIVKDYAYSASPNTAIRAGKKE